MRTALILAGVLALLGAVPTVPAQAAPARPDTTLAAIQVIPRPVRVVPGAGRFTLTPRTRIVAAVDRLIDQAAAYKINWLHLHVADDQGFRVAIAGFPNLTAIGGQGAVGTGGRTVDPGGSWTQAQYRSVVAHASARFMTVVPEVDSPGHDNAIIMSEFGDTANPRLDGHPQDINCSVNHPPVWDYTQDVGISALCLDSRNTWAITSAIVRQLGALTPGSLYDLGGDEVPAALMSPADYAAFVDRESGIVQAQHKTVMGWADIAAADTHLSGP